MRRDRGRIAIGLAAVAAFAALVVAVVAVVAMPAGASGRFAAAEAALRDRVRSDRLPGGALLVASVDRGVSERRTFGRFTPTTVIPIASASKWLTAATVMTLVDEGRIALDDPIARYLDGFTGRKATVTIREALSHTTGFSYQDCAGDQSVSLASCTKSIAASEPFATPGTAFRYTAVGFVLAARVVEVVTGQPFEAAFRERIATPVGMRRTHFTRGREHAPDPAGSATSTLDDYGRFLRMMASAGVIDGRRVLSVAATAEIMSNQVGTIDTRGDPAVRVTGIPTYGLGVWRDVTNADGGTEIVSGNGAFGFYPWLDDLHHTYGVVAVADLEHGSEHAVPASQRIARLAWTAAP